LFLGFDPGKDKCGLAVLNADRQAVFHGVVPSSQAIAQIQFLLEKFPISLLIIGDRTTSKAWQTQIKSHFPNLSLVTIDESYSSQQAKQRYWQIYPPQGLQRLITLGMRTPPRSVDDIVAIILVERYLSKVASLHS
jgi:RNase H-fold protein (predicted Holliday junction resolvase)